MVLEQTVKETLTVLMVKGTLSVLMVKETLMELTVRVKVVRKEEMALATVMVMVTETAIAPKYAEMALDEIVPVHTIFYKVFKKHKKN